MLSLTDVFLTLWALLSRSAPGGTLQTLALGTAGRTAEHRVPHSEPQLERVALVWLLVSDHLDLPTPKFLGVCVAYATRPSPNQDTPIFQELVPLFPVQLVSLPSPHRQRPLS